MRITKRLTDGTYTGGRVLSHNWASSIDTQGDVVATGGQWWAVWTEFVGTSCPQLDLFQAYTIGGIAHGRQRITNHPLWDWGPKLALTPGSTFPLTLVIPHGPSRVAVAGGVVYVGWTATVNRTFVASRVGGVWDGAFASPAGVPRFQFLVGLASSAGKATAVNVSMTSRLYATTET